MAKREREYLDFSTIVKEAEVRVLKMDDIDKKSGFATPQACDILTSLRAIQSAIECGITTRDWKSIEEAYVMLDQIIKKNE